MTARRRKHTDLPDHMMKGRNGAYKYVRRVPTGLQEALGLARWDLSLGSDVTRAVDRARAYAMEHDALIARLAEPKGLESYKGEQAAQLAVLPLVMAGALGAETTGIDVSAPVWRRTEDMLKQARALPEKDERDRLATFAAYAFGDRKHIESQPTNDAFGNMLADHLQPVRPTDSVAAMMFEALKSVLDARLSELAPITGGDTSLHLEELMKDYSGRSGKSPNTQRAYKAKAAALIAAEGSHPLPHYTEERLQNHFDALAKKGVSAQSIHQHYHTLKSLWAWASKKKKAQLAGLTFPDIDLPEITDSVEETRWQAFSDTEIKRVWELLQAHWGPDANTRMAPERRAAFLVAVRVMLYTGMRPNEVFKLVAADVQNGQIHIKKTKTKQARKIPLSVHIADFPGFLANGGFKDCGGTVATSMSDKFTAIIRANGFTNDRHVLYSLKDTLVDRLQRQGVPDDLMRGVIGHLSGQGKLRHYKTPFGESTHGMRAMQEALDAITYW